MPPMTAAENMALDDTLLELKGQGKIPNTIRFLQFSPPAVLVGYHQSVQEEIRTSYCQEKDIDVNRRITGGGAILFDENQLGWEVICDKSYFDIRIPDGRLFKILCDPVVTSLDLLGLKADFRPRNDIEIRGRKICGTGGTDSDDAFLFQGTMLVDFDVDTMLKALRIPVEKLKAKEIDSVKERVTCLNWELGYTPPLEDIKRAIGLSFEEHLEMKLEPGALTDNEKLLFEKKLPYYRSLEWIDKVKPKLQKREWVQGAYKSDAGMVRFTLVVNLPQRRIKDIYITGDFFSFPSRALYDMESRLKGARLDRDYLHNTIREFFDEGLIVIQGMQLEDFLKPLDLALEKIAISEYGIPLQLCNLISLTNCSFDDIIREKPSALLLPYCSKLTSCELRFRKGCRVCGGCTVGTAWSMGLKKKIKAISIVSFEDLWQELLKMKSAGVSAFIGCCCQPFFAKHVDDFRNAGLPGILLDIDNTTCYDLGQIREAYAGQFESQTHLNIELLRTVLNVVVG